MNIPQYSHRLSITIVTLLNLKDKRSKSQKLGWIYLMLKPVTGLSITMPILRLNFTTNYLILIHQTIWTYDISGKTHNPTNHIMDNNIYKFLHITLVKSLSSANSTSNLSESNYIYPYYKWYNLCSSITNSLAVLRIIIQALDKNSCYTVIQPLGKCNCL